MNHFLLAVSAALFLSGCAGYSGLREAGKDSAEIDALLNDWHDAASKADFARYFGHMTPESVFIGTDAGEYWTGQQFKDFAKPYFDQGKGWTYIPHDRHIYIADDRQTAWFDEKLTNAKYGETRSSGVCVLRNGRWKITHYTLSFAVPNDAAEAVVKIIREQPGSK
ncbi:MAG: nuclear transport factor 2 family protein [Phycisphaerales bacterium]|nr:nuclear transport factor 2 family protein [Phycisphaerales bacterium]